MVVSGTNGHKREGCSTDRCIIKYRKHFYDITEFAHKHPGGTNTIRGIGNTDITARFMKAPPHSDAAMYLMNEYKIPASCVDSTKEAANGTTTKEQMKPMRRHTATVDDDRNNNSSSLDDSMEYLVDWSSAMLPQIKNITEHYDEWVHKPVDRPLRLFGPWYLEMCTKTPWWVIPVVWIPVIGKCMAQELTNAFAKGNTELFSFLAFFVGGILLWTLLEYTLHRWVFHMKVGSDSNPWLCTFHFMIHGLHHKVPFDPMRLVFPPVPGFILAAVIYTPLSFLLPHPRVILGGALCGYLCYDLIHYYLHYGNPSTAYMYHMKRYHYQHHFAHQDIGYGISSPLWDFVFNTRIRLRKLRYQLLWN